MVIYDLQCTFGHRFEGWFPNAEAFEKQKKLGLVSCSFCGHFNVERVPSGGHVACVRSAQVQQHQNQQKHYLSPKIEDKKSHRLSIDTAINLDPITIMKAVTKYVQDHCKNVGDQFTEKATKMHRGEAPNEPIYGTATNEDYDKMDEEGVSYSVIPKLSEEFEN